MLRVVFDGDDPAPILHSFSETTHVYAGRFVFELPNTIIYYYITKYYSYNNTNTKSNGALKKLNLKIVGHIWKNALKNGWSGTTGVLTCSALVPFESVPSEMRKVLEYYFISQPVRVS